jgi:5-methylcytosine-specific restriction enzyme A
MAAGVVRDRSGAGQQNRRREISRSAMSRRPSKKLAASRDALTAARAAAYQREQGRCARCGGRADELQHRLARGMGGTSDPQAHALSHVAWLCRACHGLIERQDRAQGAAEGWVVFHGQSAPAVVPVLYRGRWALLADDGSVTFTGAAVA